VHNLITGERYRNPLNGDAEGLENSE
jgi:hypothetical protein